jgi:hypothetical protein
MKEILLRGQPFIRFKQASAGQHSVRRLYLRVARDPADFSVIHMYKSLCARILGADAKIRFPRAAHTEGMYRDYRTPFFDDTEIAPQHPMNRDSIYELSELTQCSVTGVAVARYIVINGYKFEYARSMPAEKIIEVTYGMLNCRPSDILGDGARVLMTKHMMGDGDCQFPHPEPPPDAQSPCFHMDTAAGGGRLPDRENPASGPNSAETCLACSYWHSPADVWAASGRHRGQNRCNCPTSNPYNPPQLTRYAEDLFLFTAADINPRRCFTVTFTARHGALILQPPTALQGLLWVKCPQALKRFYTLSPSTRPYMRLDEYFYASFDCVAAARKIDDLFSLLPSPIKDKAIQDRSVFSKTVSLVLRMRSTTMCISCCLSSGSGRCGASASAVYCGPDSPSTRGTRLSRHRHSWELLV